MGYLPQQTWAAAQQLYEATRDTPAEAVEAKEFLRRVKGAERHSYGVVLATPTQIKNLGLMDKKEFPELYKQNIVGEQEISLYDPEVRDYMGMIRGKEGTILVRSDDHPAVLRNGLVLPTVDHAEIADMFGVSDTGTLIERLEIDEEVGFKVMALLGMAAKNPRLALLRLDGQNYLFHGGLKYDLEDAEGKTAVDLRTGEQVEPRIQMVA